MNHAGARGALAGALAIAFWSASVALSRDLAESLGPWTAAAATYLPAGLVGLAWLTLTGRLGAVLALGRAYLLGCGALFATYLVSFSLAVGLCRTGQEVVEIGLVNYLWPALTLLFSLPLQGHRASPWLIPGLALALSGVFLASLGPGPLSWNSLAGAFGGFVDHLLANPTPYALSLLNAVTWSLYSNLARRLLGREETGAVPLFLLAGGLALLAGRLMVTEHSRLDEIVGLELAAMILLPGLLAYALWEAAMRSRHMILVTALAYLIPLLSTLVTTWRQGLPMGPGLWLACGLLVAGAEVCRRSIRPQK